METKRNNDDECIQIDKKMTKERAWNYNKSQYRHSQAFNAIEF